MGRPRHDEHAVATSTRILEAAVAAFARAGFAGATLADIAAAAGITRPSLLYHFDTKERLYAAALGQVFADIGTLIAAATAAAANDDDDGDDDVATGPARLLGLVESFAGFALARPATARLLLRAIVADDDPATRALLVAHAVPAIDRVEAFAAGAGAAPRELRRTLVMVIVDVLSRAAAADVAPALWGPGSVVGPAARLLFPATQGHP